MENGEGGSWLERNSQYVIVKLARPIPFEGKDLLELKIREPRMDDLEKIPAGAYEKPATLLGHLLASCAGVSRGAIRCLTLPDMNKCSEALAELGFTLPDAYKVFASESSLPPGTGPTGSD